MKDCFGKFGTVECRHRVQLFMYLMNCWHRNLTRNTTSGNDAMT